MKESEIRRKRLQAIVDELGLSVAARKLGKPDRQLNDMLAERKSFGARIAREMEVTGGLPKYYFEEESKLEDTKASINHKHPDNDHLVKNEPAQIPVIGKLSALTDHPLKQRGRLVVDDKEYAQVFSTDASAFAVRVEDNSMYPKYAPGEYALVEPNTDPELEDDVLVRIKSGDVMLRRLFSRRGGIHLGSYNESASYFFTADEIVWLYYVPHPIPARKIKTRS